MGYEYCVFGDLSVDYLVTADGEIHEGILGGGASYAAAGARLWTDSVGLVASISDDFPKALLEQLGQHGISTQDIQHLADSHTHHQFLAYEQTNQKQEIKATSKYVQLGRQIPKDLLAATHAHRSSSGERGTYPLPERLPNGVSRCESFHLAGVPADPAKLIGHHLRKMRSKTISYDPPTHLMKRDRQEDLKLALQDIHIFLPSERQSRRFFQPERPSLWEMAESFADMGPEIIVIKRGERGQALYDARDRSRWHIPAYPSQLVDVTGAGHSFAGGFFVGMGQHDDPMEAALQGSASASMTIEGVGFHYPLMSLPGLVAARRDRLREGIQRG